MKTTFTLLAFLFAVCATANAQVAPAATGGAATLSYSVRYSQTADMYGNGLGVQQGAIVSGDLNYMNGSERLPFAVNYGGGYIWTIAGQNYMNGLFQHLLLSQGIDWRKWKVTVSDDASYRPSDAATDFSGVPGIGEPVGGSGPNPPSDAPILALKTHVLANVASGGVSHPLNYAMFLTAGGTSDLLRYPDGDGLNIDQLMANVSVSRRLSARNSLTGTYTFSQYSYPDRGFSFQSDTGLFGFTRVWNAKISSNISAGPEWKSSSNSAVVPSSLTYAVNAGASYRYRLVGASLTFVRGVNNGGGYLLGAEADTVGANFTRGFGRQLSVELTGDYRHLSGLANNGVTNSKFGGAQVTRRFGRHCSAYASYTAVDQSSSSALPTNTLNTLLQIVGFGISYTPQKTHLVN